MSSLYHGTKLSAISEFHDGLFLCYAQTPHDLPPHCVAIIKSSQSTKALPALLIVMSLPAAATMGCVTNRLILQAMPSLPVLFAINSLFIPLLANPVVTPTSPSPDASSPPPLTPHDDYGDVLMHGL